MREVGVGFRAGLGFGRVRLRVWLGGRPPDCDLEARLLDSTRRERGRVDLIGARRADEQERPGVLPDEPIDPTARIDEPGDRASGYLQRHRQTHEPVRLDLGRALDRQRLLEADREGEDT